jgi:hypothetical protein
MSTILPPNNQQSIGRPQTLQVWVAGSHQPDLRVLSLEHKPGPHFDCCTIESISSSSSPLTDAASLLPAVTAPVELVSDIAGTVFAGKVALHQVKFTKQGQRLQAVAHCDLAGQLSQTIAGRYELVAGQAVFAGNTHCQFNSGPGSWASGELYTLAGRDVRIFSDGPTCRRWTVADALDYLLAAAAPKGIWTPSPDELQALAGDIDLGELNATGDSVGKVLSHIAGHGGLILSACRDGSGIIFSKPGSGPVRNLQIQVPPSQFSPSQTNITHGQVEIAQPRRQPGILALGQRKQYEITVELSPGWDLTTQTQRWRNYTPSRSDNWPAMANVLRKWVLNEHGWYCGSPWNLPAYDFSQISQQDFTSRQPRKFQPCLSSDPVGQGLGVIVEVKSGQQLPWRRWPGSVLVSGGECSIYLGGDALPADYFNAALAGQASVRVTATIAADAHLSAELPGDESLPQKVIDLGSRAAWRTVHATSIFFGATGLGQPAQRDDSAALQAFALASRDSAVDNVDGEFSIGWIDGTYCIGDVIERLDGQWVEFAGQDISPSIRSIRHDYIKQITSFTLRA